MYDVIIVGGGFSGLVLANLLLDKKFNNFLLLERNDRVGKKILVTGNGRCNLTNTDLSVKNYHGEHPDFCQYAIKKYDNEVIARFFKQMGLLLSEENGKVYPLSKVANSVLDTLRFRLDGYVKTGRFVSEVVKKSGSFCVAADGGERFYAKNVVFAFGGNSGQNMGTDGRSYRLASAFGHRVTKLFPSLVQMRSDKFGKGLKGIKHYAKVSLYDDKRYICSSSGDFLITDTGVSGNTVFTLSAYLYEARQPRLLVDFIPEYDVKAVTDALYHKSERFGDILSAGDLLTGYVHGKLSYHIAAELSLQKRRINELASDDIYNMVRLVKEYPVPITGTLGFDFSQVTHGGVSTEGVSNETMESRIVPGLYIIGEALDIDGDCGGYNLQWAFSSACAAAEAIK